MSNSGPPRRPEWPQMVWPESAGPPRTPVEQHPIGSWPTLIDITSGPPIVQARSAARQSILGFERVIIGPHERAIVRAQPLMPFRGKSLFVPASMARHFCIMTLRVGMTECVFVNSARDGAPGEYFSWVCGHQDCEESDKMMAECVKKNPELHRGRELRFDTAVPGILVSIEVLNVSDKPQAFHAVIDGLTLD
jgi:hypothetical protein